MLMRYLRAAFWFRLVVSPSRVKHGATRPKSGYAIVSRVRVCAFLFSALLLAIGFTARAVAETRTSYFQYSGGSVAFIQAAGESGDAAFGMLAEGFAYGAAVEGASFAYSQATSLGAYKTTFALREAMANEDIHLLVFAGGEEAAVVAALLSADFQMPVLNLTSDAISLTSLSRYFYELLPSAQAQGELLGTFAVDELHISAASALLPDRDRMVELWAGFSTVFARHELPAIGLEPYPAESASIKSRLADLHTALDPQTAPRAVLIAVPMERLDIFAPQISPFSADTYLLGNAGWSNEESLARYRRLTEGMHIVSPLLPFVADTTAALRNYYEAQGEWPNEWFRVGADAAAFVQEILAGGAKSRKQVLSYLTEQGVFEGASIKVDFRYSHENREARILKFDGHKLSVVR
jgi:ABC-type branched-subunit amino acid transport system substrate-binding protein